MNLPDLKQLDKVIALCRKRGVKSIKIDNIELTLSEDAPQKASKTKSNAFDYIAPNDHIESDTLTEDQLLMWSTGQTAEAVLKKEE